MSLKAWKLCRHNHKHGSKADSLISDIVVMEKKDEIVVHDHIETKQIDLYLQDDTGDDSDLQLFCSTLHICMIDWYEKNIIFGQQTSVFHQQKRNGQKRKLLKGSLKLVWLHITWPQE